MRLIAILCVAGLCVSMASAQSNYETVKLNGHTFTIPEGYSIELAAKTPIVDRPIVASFDEKRRLFVADSSGSNERPEIQLKNPTHRILRLEDTDGDGVFDKTTVFADKMMFPEGILCFGGSVYVGAPPHIWKLTDTDGDGKADKREIWFDGKTVTGCANDLHGPYLGPDGYIYWCKGAFAKQTYTLPNGKTLTTRASHIFRAKPDGTAIEPVMTGGMDNPVGLAFLPNGERFFTTTFLQHPAAGKRDGIIHAIYGGIYGKDHDVIYDLDHKWTSPNLMPVMTHLGPAAPAGMTCVGETLFATQFNLRKVSKHVLKQAGSSYVTEDSDFVVSDNQDFHPTDVLQDKDGSMLIVDTGGWYKLCCPSSQLMKTDILGAIYRVRKKGPQTNESIVKSDDRELQKKIHLIGLKRDAQGMTSLVAALRSANLVTRRMAVEAIGLIGDSKLAPALVSLLEANDLDRTLEHSITYALIQLGSDEALIDGMKNQNPRVRRCVMVARDQLGLAIPVNLVRLGLNSNDPKFQETVWWIISRHPKMVKELTPLIRERLLNPDLKPNDWNMISENLQKLASTSVIRILLAELLPEAPQSIAKTRLLPLMRQSGIRDLPSSWSLVFREMLSNPDNALVDDVLETVRKLPIPKEDAVNWNKAFQFIAENASNDTTRVLAMASMLGSPVGVDDENAKRVLTMLVSSEAKQRSIAADALVRIKWSDSQLQDLVKLMPTTTISERDRILTTLQQSTSESLGLEIVKQLHSPAWRTTLRVDQVRTTFAKYPPSVRAESEKLNELLNADLKRQTADLEALAKRLPSGDIRRGQAVFNSTKTQCIACHNLGYVGGKIGPDLTRIGSIRNDRDLLESIVYPSASFVRSYEPVSVKTVDGRVFNGVPKKDAPDELILTLAADKEVRLDRKEIEEVTPGKVSIMPAGLAQQISEQDLADLIAFLRNCK